MKRFLVIFLAAAVSLLLIFVGVTWAVVWKPINDRLQNDPVIGNKLTIQVQVQQPANVTQSATLNVTYSDAGNNAYFAAYTLSGNTFVVKGEVLHLLWSPARFRLTKVVVAPKNINALRSVENDFDDSDLNTPGSGLILTITHCSVLIGPITDTQLHTLTITIAPDSTSANSCLPYKG